MKSSTLILRIPILICSFCLVITQSQEDNFVPGGTIPEGHPDYTYKVPKYKFSNTLKKTGKRIKEKSLIKKIC